MPLAKWSGKPAVKDQQDVSFSFEVRKANGVAVKILERKIRCRGIQVHSWHLFTP